MFSRMAWAGEVTPQKQVVWRMAAPPGTEFHSLQPIGLDRVLLLQNDPVPTVMIVDSKSGAYKHK